MSVLRIATVVVSLVLASGGAVLAQSLDGPANLPPASFDGMGFNDANGCAFMRAGLSGATVWVARVDQARQPVCGLEPTFGDAAPLAAPETTQVVTAAPATAVPVAIAAAPTPARTATPRVGAPINTVATLTTAPQVRAPVAASVATPSVAPVVQPERLTLAQACAGRTGVQPGLISSRTGQPIDCGGTPEVATSTAVAPRATAITPVPVAAPVAPRMTLAQICAQTAATGIRYVNQATGQPVACPDTAVMLALATVAPVTAEPPRMTLANACAMSQQSGTRYINAATGRPIDCGPVGTAGVIPSQNGAVGHTTAVVAQTVQTQPGGTQPQVAVFTWPFQSPPVPASNPTGLVAGYSGAPAGYEPVWTDGRLNQNRGIPAAVTDRMSTSNTPVAATHQIQSALTGHRYVQVGTFGNPANVDRATATLQSLGLPVGTRTITQNGTLLRVVAAGPFASDTEVDSALRAVRAAGYDDAFPLN